MKALLLAGGLGTRLRPLTEDLPKPMAPLANRPWLEHLLMHLKKEGIEQFVFAVKHYPEVIQRHFGDGRRFGVEIQYAVEQELLGTAGAIKNAEAMLGDQFLVINADVVQMAPLRPMLEFHRNHPGAVTIGLTRVEDPSAYGVVEITDTGEIKRFVEKPPRDEAPSNLINAGIYIMEKEVLKYIPPNREVSIERETFPLLIRSGVGVYGTAIEGYWMDMGTTERYRQAHWDVLDGRLSLAMPAIHREDGIFLGKNVQIGRGVVLNPPVLIGNDVVLEDNSIIGPYVVIGDRSRIGSGTSCSYSIIWNNTSIAPRSNLVNCILCDNLLTGPDQMMHGAVIKLNVARRMAQKTAKTAVAKA